MTESVTSIKFLSTDVSQILRAGLHFPTLSSIVESLLANNHVLSLHSPTYSIKVSIRRTDRWCITCTDQGHVFSEDQIRYLSGTHASCSVHEDPLVLLSYLADISIDSAGRSFRLKVGPTALLPGHTRSLTVLM